ncbi:MAG: hypothetical protein EAZ51_02260 [Sphingobacteriales bacterium]|nr:MAG: hypothetical protein EAZ64_02135 [Sphingobacteriales bacterium]TAF82551.1 MAG: hypothetical protein EAZ51_02260 [Sphingobacteriales bacterium]
MSSFPFNRTQCKAQTAAEAADHRIYYQNLTWQERMKVTNYLNSIAFNYPENSPPKLDRTKFKAKGRD